MTCYVSYSTTPQGVRVQVMGEVDLAVSEILYRILHRVLGLTVGAVEVDLRQVTFLDCAGMATLVRAREQAQRRERVLFVSGPRGNVLWVLGRTGLLSALTADAPAPTWATEMS